MKTKFQVRDRVTAHVKFGPKERVQAVVAAVILNAEEGPTYILNARDPARIGWRRVQVKESDLELVKRPELQKAEQIVREKVKQ